MSKGKKVIILLAALSLLVTGLIVYRRREIPLTDVLPDGDWTGVLLLQGDPDDPEREWEVPVPADGVLGAVSAARVTRGGGKPSLETGISKSIFTGQRVRRPFSTSTPGEKLR